MTTETTPVKRGRGRPRKEVASTVESIRELTPEQRLSMQAEAMQVFAMAAERLKALGINMSAIAAPPDEITVERTAPEPENFVSDVETVAPHVPVEAGPEKPKPGQKIGEGMGATWVPWNQNDLDPNDKVLVVPEAIPGFLYPAYDKSGRQKLLIDVNGLQCWMTVGVPQEVNRYYYNAYKNGYDQWVEAEEFKRYGPQGASWGDRDGKSTWRVEHNAPSFGINEDGRYYPSGRQLNMGTVPNRPSAADLAPEV